MGSAQYILEHLIEVFPSLSPRLQQAASYILKQPQEVAIRTMRALAADAGVAPSTMVRLAHSLDFENYAAMRVPFETAMRQRNNTFSDRAQWLKTLADQNEASRIVGNIAVAAMDNMESAFVGLEPEKLEKAADILLAARYIYVAGVGAMKFTSGYFQHVASLALDNIIMVDPLGGNNFDDMIKIGPEDVLFCTAFSPIAKSSVRTVEFAKSTGASVVAITDSPISPVASGASAILLVPTESPQFFPSQVAVMAVIEALIALIVSKGGEKCVKRIQHVVNFRQSNDYYW